MSDNLLDEANFRVDQEAAGGNSADASKLQEVKKQISREMEQLNSARMTISTVVARYE